MDQYRAPHGYTRMENGMGPINVQRSEDVEDRVADVLADFAVVLMEELAKELGLGWEVEMNVIERISPILDKFRKGESLDPSNAYRR